MLPPPRGDGVQVHGGHADRHAELEFLLTDEVELTPLDEGRIEAGAAHVAAQEIAEAEEAPQGSSRRGPAGGAREDGGQRVRRDGLRREGAPGGLDETESPTVRRPREAGQEVAHVPAHERMQVGGHGGRGGPDELAGQRREVRGEDDVRVGPDLAQGFPRGALVRGVSGRMQEGDPHGFHAGLEEGARRRAYRLGVQRNQTLAGCQHPFRHLAAPLAGHQRVLSHLRGQAGAPCPVAQLQHVPEALRDDESAAGAFPLQDGVGGHRGPVGDLAYLVQRRPGGPEALQDTAADFRGDGGRLRQDDVPAALVQADDIGERPADVDPDPVRSLLPHHASSVPVPVPLPVPVPAPVPARAALPLSVSPSPPQGETERVRGRSANNPG